MSGFGGNDDLGQIRRRSYSRRGMDREQRLTITLAVGTIVLLALGVGIGFAIGRATAPQPQPQQAPAAVATPTVTIIEETETVEVDEVIEDVDVVDAVEESVDSTPPPRPKQKAPSDGAVIDATRVMLKWSKVEDDSGEPVTYSFEIQDRLSSGSYGKTQVITDLKETSYSARVLQVKRRWRVWAVDAADNKSKKSGWRYYQGKPAPKPTPTQAPPTPSDETT